MINIDVSEIRVYSSVRLQAPLVFKRTHLVVNWVIRYEIFTCFFKDQGTSMVLGKTPTLRRLGTGRET